MENNQENVQNEVNNVEQNVGENKPQKSGKGKTIALMIIVLVLVLAVGIGGGFLLANKDKNDSNNNVNTTETQENKQEQNKTSKKIDENKPWVYDAEYGKDNEEKKLKPQYSNEVYSTVDMIKIPYININSDDAKNVNSELKNLYTQLYNSFGKNGEVVMESSYTVYNRDNNLSIVIRIDSGVLNGGKTHEYKIYNFNLETLKKADIFEVAQKCGFKSKEDLNKAIENSISKAKKDLKASENATRKDDLYYINNCGEFNIMVLSMSEIGYIDLVVDTSMINMEKSESSQNQATSNNDKTVTETDKEYAKEYIKIIDKVEAEYPNSKYDLIYFNNDDIPDLVVDGPGLNLYMYENGKVYTLMEYGTVGIGGSKYYDYLENKGALYNYGNGYAGAISQVIIKILNSKREFDEFKIISEGATLEPTNSMYEQVQKELAETAGYYYNGKKISEEEFNNKLKESSVSSNEKDYKALYGSKTVEEVKKLLQ